jgi:hypothetical protein
MMLGRAEVAPLAILVVFAQDPVHRTDRAQIDATLEQTVIHLDRRLIAKLLAVEHLANALAFCRRQGPRLAHRLARAS